MSENIIAYPAHVGFPANGTVLAGGNAPADVTTLPVAALGHSWITAHGSHIANGLEGINRRGFCCKEGLTGTPTICLYFLQKILHLGQLTAPNC